MFETLKKMFFFDDPVTNPVEKAEIKVEPEISEPVISFVEVFKKNPRRFKISRTYGEGPRDMGVPICAGSYQGLSTSNFNYLYSIRDSVTGNCFSMERLTTLKTTYTWDAGETVVHRDDQHRYIPVSKNLEWITPVELEYVYYEISKFLNKRAAERKEKLNSIRRNRYIRQYCENVDLFIEE